MILILRGLSQKGKNRIRELGEEWKIILDGAFQGQPAFLVKSIQEINLDKPTHICYDRWVLKENDSDLEIVGVK